MEGPYGNWVELLSDYKDGPTSTAKAAYYMSQAQISGVHAPAPRLAETPWNWHEEFGWVSVRHCLCPPVFPLPSRLRHQCLSSVLQALHGNFWGDGWNMAMLNPLAVGRRLQLAAAAAGRGGWKPPPPVSHYTAGAAAAAAGHN